MEKLLKDKISPKAVRRAFGFITNFRYEAFIWECAANLKELKSCDVKILSIKLKPSPIQEPRCRRVDFLCNFMRENEYGDFKEGAFVWDKGK